jgi:hypothetical protein
MLKQTSLPLKTDVSNLVGQYATILKAYSSNPAYECVFNPLFENDIVYMAEYSDVTDLISAKCC